MNQLLDGLRKGKAAVVRLVVSCIFVPLERLLPVRDDIWCFCTWGSYPHTIDNPRAVFEKVKNDPAITKVVLTRGAGGAAAGEGGINVHLVPAGSLVGMYYLARARVVIIGYSLSFMCLHAKHLTRKHLIIQLSHGIVLRPVCRMAEGEDWWARETPLYAATIGSAERDHEIMPRVYSPIPAERVWVTGLPRNSFILDDEAELPADYQAMLSELREQVGGRRLVLYAPTWRKQEKDHFAFSSAQLECLDELLAKHNAVLGIRGHSNVRDLAAYAPQIRSDAFLSLNDLPDVNVALRLTDVLITDYSSIYLDFLLTGRPVLHFVYDLDAYRAERSFLYELEEVFGGPAPRSFQNLVENLDLALTDPQHDLERRDRVRRLFHAHPEGSAELVARNIKRLVWPSETIDGRALPKDAASRPDTVADVRPTSEIPAVHQMMAAVDGRYLERRTPRHFAP